MKNNFEVRGDEPHRELFINGDQFGGVHVSSGSPCDLYLPDQEATERFSAFTLDEIGYEFNEMKLPYEVEWCPLLRGIYIAQGSYQNRGPERRWAKDAWRLSLYFQDHQEWRGSFSEREYKDELKRLIRLTKTQEEVEVTIEVEFNDCSPNIPLKQEILRCLGEFRPWHEQAIENLLTRVRENSLITSFEFRPQIQAYCEQYLIYFVQFLRDLGVEATSEIRHEAGKVLFTVTPKDHFEALDTIRAALNVYLKLPFADFVDDEESEIAVQRLESNVHRLKSDLKLAAAELQTKDMTIEAQQLIISVQKGLLGGELIRTREPESKADETDREELFGGLAALTVYKKGGAEISLAKLYRRLRDLFIREK